MHKGANARETDRTPVMPTDHREARGATIHLVDLVHQREPANALASRCESPVVGRERPGIRRRLRRRSRGFFFRRNVDLIDADAAPGAHLGGKRLFSKIERHPRDAPVVVLRQALFDPRLELRIGVEQALERRFAKRQHDAIGNRFDARRARRLCEDGQFAEEVAFSQIADVLPMAVLSDEGAKASGLDDVQRTRLSSLTNENLVRFHRDALEICQKRLHRVGRKLRERGELFEEIAQLPVQRLELEVALESRVLGEQRLEHIAVETERLDVAAGANGYGAGRLLEEPNLAERIARLEQAE